MLKRIASAFTVILVSLLLLGCSEIEDIFLPRKLEIVRFTESTKLLRSDDICIFVEFQYYNGVVVKSSDTYMEQGRKAYRLAIAQLTANGEALAVPDDVPSRCDLAFDVEIRPELGGHVFIRAYLEHPAKEFLLVDNGLHVTEIAQLPARLVALYAVARRQIATIADTCVDELGCR